MIFNRFLLRAVLDSRVGSRSVFTSSKPDTANPNWLRVGLAFGTSVFLWGLLFRQHSADVQEYKRHNYTSRRVGTCATKPVGVRNCSVLLFIAAEEEKGNVGKASEQNVVQRRPMSSLPGGSGENIVYALLCGGALVGGVSYAYITVTSDSARYNERVAEVRARPKTEWVPKPWPPKSKDEEEGEEEEEAAEAAGGEAEAEAGEEEAAAADSEAEAVVEEVAEVVAEAAEVVAEVAEGVAEAAQEVEKVAEEVAQVAETVEEAAQAVTEPATADAEDSESNVLLAAASTLEIPKTVEVKEDLAPGDVKVAPEGETLAPVESKPVEEIATVEAPALLQETPAPVEVVPVVDEAPGPVEVPPVVEEETAPVEVAPVVEETPALVEVVPVVEEAPAPVEVVPEVEEALRHGGAHLVKNWQRASPVVEAAAAAPLESLAEDPKREYIVVVLEGTAKAEKRPKVLGVGPMTGRIIPAPDDDDAPVSEGKRRLLRMQMQ
ncbi:calphotin-like isoform X12 [Lates japonicus]|uniref:Calphotin-like isoform X12 n=1 Tax=Lates japonicus TaxID=270547 RepID=A0AAD3MZH1_LATJO|nr:calphotin-like isoform X12 [Lates japonicus]